MLVVIGCDVQKHFIGTAPTRYKIFQEIPQHLPVVVNRCCARIRSTTKILIATYIKFTYYNG